MNAVRTLLPLALFLTACDDVATPGEGGNEEEVITTIELTFTPEAGDAVVYSWADPEDDGDASIDDVVLDADTTYTLTLTFTNELASPAEDITEEVEDEGDEHQVFLIGDGVASPATTTPQDPIVTVAYVDEDEGGLPLGLEHSVTTGAAGTGTLGVVLAHLPAQDGEAVKVADLAQDVADGGIASLPGDVDVDVTFPLVVE